MNFINWEMLTEWMNKSDYALTEYDKFCKGLYFTIIGVIGGLIGVVIWCIIIVFNVIKDKKKNKKED